MGDHPSNLFVRDAKQSLFPLFDRIWAIRAFSDDTLYSVCGLLEVLLVNLGKRLNILMQRLSIKGLLEAAHHSSDANLSRSSLHLSERLATS
jgi:hypothetical protein